MADDDPYSSVVSGALKFKNKDGIKKKKKKRKITVATEDGDSKAVKTAEDERDTYIYRSIDMRTKAEKAFDERREERDLDNLRSKVSKTHRERIMEFNDKLESISEHNDIPKISWTK